MWSQRHHEYVTDFGTIKIPRSPMLNLVLMLSKEPRYFWQGPNHATVILNQYLDYITKTAEELYRKDEPNWVVDVLSFEAWMENQ